MSSGERPMALPKANNQIPRPCANPPPPPAEVRMPAVVRMPACHSRMFKGERPIGAATG